MIACVSINIQRSGYAHYVDKYACISHANVKHITRIIFNSCFFQIIWSTCSLFLSVFFNKLIQHRGISHFTNVKLEIYISFIYLVPNSRVLASRLGGHSLFGLFSNPLLMHLMRLIFDGYLNILTIIETF